MTCIDCGCELPVKPGTQKRCQTCRQTAEVERQIADGKTSRELHSGPSWASMARIIKAYNRDNYFRKMTMDYSGRPLDGEASRYVYSNNFKLHAED